MTDLSNVGLYAVYDGHGGDLTSQYLATFLHINLLRHQSFPTDTRKALIDTFLETNEEMRRSLKREAERERVEQLGGVFIPVADDSLGKSHSAMYLNNLGGPGVGGGYSDTESINSEYNTSMASSMHLVIPRDGSNHVASMGMKHYHSTPAILHEGNGSGAGGHTSKVEAGSSVHQDQRAGEAEPAVTQTEALPRVYYRLNGLVSVTRAFGDFRISCMTAEPEVVEFTVDPERDCFLLLCSDGLIDTMSPSDIWTFIEQFKKKSEKHNGDAADETKEKQQDKEEDDPGDVGAWGRGTDDWMSDDSSTSLAEALAKAAIDRGSGDNVSVIIIYI
ncbi:hypothetical protein HK102_001724 [Quaeritorhiza haematococci]|nr:hypothetical protein HK102_001724 [Quaeritorhiza haematococci]